MGACKMDFSILLCRLRDAASITKYSNTTLTITTRIVNPTIPPNIPILWFVVRPKLEEASTEMFTSPGEHDSPSLALQKLCTVLKHLL